MKREGVKGNVKGERKRKGGERKREGVKGNAKG